MANGNYHIYDNTSQGYVYNVAVKLAPVFAGEMSTAEGSGYNWWTLMRSRIKSLTGYSSGVGATLIDNLLPVISSYDYNNKHYKESGVWGSTPDRQLTAYGNLYVRVSRTVNAALMSYANLSQVPNNLTSPSSYCDTAEPTETGDTGGWFSKKWRREWYAFGAPAMAYPLGIPQPLPQLRLLTTTSHLRLSDCLHMIYSSVQRFHNSFAYQHKQQLLSTVNSLATAVKNKFFTNPTVNDIQAFMGRAVIAQQVISLLPANTWYQNAMAAGYDPQDYNGMRALYSTAVPYYNSLNGASADAKAVLTTNYSMNLTQYNAWKEQLLDDIQLYELRELKNTIDQKVDELYQYVVPEEEREASFPHLIYGNATEAYTDLQLDFAAGQFAGWLTAITGYKPANVSAVFTEGLGYIQGAQD